MTVDPIILIFITIAVFILGAGLLILVIFYAKLSQTLHEQTKENTDLKNKLSEQPIKLLEKAHEDSLQIIDKANKEASTILSSSKAYEDTTDASIKERLGALEKDQAAVFAKASEEMKAAYKNLLAQIQQEDMGKIQALTKDIQSDVLADFNEFRQDLEKETINSQKVVKEKIDEEYASVQKELLDYKKTQYQKIDEDIYKILYRVSEIVLSQGISFDKHKQLVMDALETAKKEQVFK